MLKIHFSRPILSLSQKSLHLTSEMLMRPSNSVRLLKELKLNCDDPFSNMGKRVSAIFRNRIGRRPGERRILKTLCYDHIGCFGDEGRLKVDPQTPAELQTQFLLHTRHVLDQLVAYGDDRSSLTKSNFNPNLPTKVIVHGFKGSGRAKGVTEFSKLLLDAEDCNVIALDWEKGAAGGYRMSAANTQLVGQQLALVLLDLVSIGALPSSIHLIGFSLGAHIAGFAGRQLLKRNIRVGRITGLDPASPLFRNHLVSSSPLPSLNNQDAAFVDVIHTDGAVLWTEGFGLMKALGHVDFFPNGGQDQPGCAHVFASVIVSHLEGTVNTSTVCNHIRAFQIFLESVQNMNKGDACQFKAWPCKSHEHFRSGMCFPASCDVNSTDGSCGIMGLRSNKGLARGQLYLVTKESPPFCGDQLQAAVVLSRAAPPRSVMILELNHGPNVTTTFRLYTEWAQAAASEARQLVLRRSDFNGGGVEYRGLAAAEFGSASPLYKTAQARLYLKPRVRGRTELLSVRVSSIDGQSWAFCGREQFLEGPDDEPEAVLAVVDLALGYC